MPKAPKMPEPTPPPPPPEDPARKPAAPELAKKRKTGSGFGSLRIDPTVNTGGSRGSLNLPV